jgi:hypothetical protein
LRLAVEVMRGSRGIDCYAGLAVERYEVSGAGGGLPHFGAVMRCGLHLEPSFRLAALL